jgi:hypothetical protein
MYITLNWKFDKKRMLPLLAHGQSQGGLGTETPGGGFKPSGGEKQIWSPLSSCGLKHHTKHEKKSPHELDIGSTFKQPEDKHCNLDQGEIENK